MVLSTRPSRAFDQGQTNLDLPPMIVSTRPDGSDHHANMSLHMSAMVRIITGIPRLDQGQTSIDLPPMIVSTRPDGSDHHANMSLHMSAMVRIITGIPRLDQGQTS